MGSVKLQQNDLLIRLYEAWGASFGGDADALFFAPGRVNLLGAHLDYNQGFVLPAAVDRGTFVLVRKRSDRRVRLRSLDREPALDLALDQLIFDREHSWANYAKGALAAMAPELPGLDLLYSGNLPIGAGLSSSASVLVATATAANEYLQHKKTKSEIVSLCHAAEVHFVGVRCGVMDHYASTFGVRDQLLYLDCRRQEHSEVPFDSARASIVVLDTTRRRELSDGRFNDRVHECGAAVEFLKSKGMVITALRDATVDQLEHYKNEMPPVLYRRAMHVATEIQRIHRGVDAMRRGDFEQFGECLQQSHASCRDLYEVSSAELDALVDAANATEGTFGARLTGAGFGGCCVAVVANKALPNFCKEVAGRYEQKTGLTPRLYIFRPAAGAGRM
ncbi:MAG: galactokinase [Planctomycetota bacterium]